MNALIKTGIKAAAAVLGAVAVGYFWDKYSGQPVKLSPVGSDSTGKPDITAAGKLAGVLALGAIVIGWIAKKLKLNFLK
jgi:hypothetical protein